MLINNKYSYILHLPEAITLMPGMNEVDSKKWDKVKDLPLVQARIDSEQLIIKELKDGETHILSSLDAKGAIKIVKETFKKELLDDWLTKEKRQNVIKAINEQIKEISL